MADFDPYLVARDVLATTDLADPSDIAEEIFNRTPKREIAGAYRMILRTMARVELGRMRMNGSAQDQTVGDQTGAQPARSSKVAGIRQYFSDTYEQRVCAFEKWKMLLDCTREDVLDLAAQSLKAANQNLAKHEKWQALADQMLADGAVTVRDLKDVAA
jgi:hypothetical protein